LACVATTLRQIAKAIDKVRFEAPMAQEANAWIEQVEHYHSLVLRVVDQT